MIKEEWKKITKVELKQISIWSHPLDKRLMIKNHSLSIGKSKTPIYTQNWIARKKYSTQDILKFQD
jgi:hypothetical protein